MIALSPFQSLDPNHQHRASKLHARTPTISRIDLGQRTLCLPEQNGRYWVILLHDRIRARKEQPIHNQLISPISQFPRTTYLVAALCSPVWQKRKRTSFKPFANAYLLDIFALRRSVGRTQLNTAPVGRSFVDSQVLLGVLKCNCTFQRLTTRKWSFPHGSKK